MEHDGEPGEVNFAYLPNVRENKSVFWCKISGLATATSQFSHGTRTEIGKMSELLDDPFTSGTLLSCFG